MRRGDPARPPAGRADARRARGARAARADAADRRAPRRAHARDGELVRLADQDRSLWDAGADRRGPGARAPAACGATSPARTRSRRRSTPSTATRRRPTGARSSRSTTSCWCSRRRRWCALNRAVAVAEVDGPEAALDERRRARASTATTCFHAIRADLLRRLGRDAEAAAPTSAPSRGPTTRRARVPRGASRRLTHLDHAFFTVWSRRGHFRLQRNLKGGRYG